MPTKSMTRPAAIAVLCALVLLLGGCAGPDRPAGATAAQPADDSGGPGRPGMGSYGGY